MFKYINMPKLVAFYLREFSVRSDGTPSGLYKFIFCLCLPFVSESFRRARLNALAIAECTNSRDQIIRVLEKIAGVRVYNLGVNDEYYASYNGTGGTPDFAYRGSDTSEVAFEPQVNTNLWYIALQDSTRTEVEGYLALLIPFYIDLQIQFDK